MTRAGKKQRSSLGSSRNIVPNDFDITVTCAFPWTQWALRRPVLGGHRPQNVFVTQNGDWPAFSNKAEFRFFDCDGLVCTNPDYFERNADRYRCALIPNGVDLDRFHPGPSERERLGLPERGPIVLMVSALIPSKKVAEGMEAVAKVPGANLVVAGDGPVRDEIHKLAGELFPGVFSGSPCQLRKCPRCTGAPTLSCIYRRTNLSGTFR